MQEIRMILSEAIPIPDQYFWYVLATVMSVLLYRMINMHMKKIDDMLKELKDSVGHLALKDAVQDEQIRTLREDVDELKG
jgi:uncharacterized membrane protein YjfL (UPF0719 family)